MCYNTLYVKYITPTLTLGNTDTEDTKCKMYYTKTLIPVKYSATQYITQFSTVNVQYNMVHNSFFTVKYGAHSTQSSSVQ